MKELKNILVAVDFNDAVGELLGIAEGLAEKFGSKVWVVHVAQPSAVDVGMEPGPEYIRSFRAEDLKDIHRNLQEICNTFLGEEIDHEALLIPGSTVEAVLEEARKLHSDLLVVGTHKHSFLHNLLQEGVSLKLLKKANIPLLAVPIEEED